MKSISCFFIFTFLLINSQSAYSQNKIMTMSLTDVIEMANESSLDAMIAKNSFRASYWAYRSHRATLLPSLNLSAILPDFNRSISQIILPDGSAEFVEQRNMSNYLSLDIKQNIALTGGQVFINTDMQRLDVISDSTITSYLTNPINIGLRQPIFSYNSFKWEKKIEPLKYQEAKKTYIKAREDVNSKAVNLFFNLALAQINVTIAETNYSNNDTLYKISTGRYNLGKIAQNDLLQMELNLLNSKSALNEARLTLRNNEYSLRSFLGIKEDVKIELLVPSEIPELEINAQKAIDEAKKNNPEMVKMDRQLIEAESDVARARAENRFSADLVANYGFTQKANNLPDAYVDPRDKQRISFGIEIPIVDWGQGRGKYKMARSNQEVIKSRVEQQTIDFEQNVFLEVAQFNMQSEQVEIKAKSDTIAQSSYEVSKNRYFIGKISVTDLNIALREKDSAQRNHIEALWQYWSQYYNIRRLTLYDFENEILLTEQFEKLID